MRTRIQRNPFSVLKLRATFLKLVSILDAPICRISEANSPDLSSVSQYYSSEVAAFMRSVLHVIPENMFAILSEVVAINANELRELPVKVVRADLREWSQLGPRHRLARATHRVSVLTEGVLAMQTTLLGVVKVCRPNSHEEMCLPCNALMFPAVPLRSTRKSCSKKASEASLRNSSPSLCRPASASSRGNPLSSRQRSCD